jgi:Ca2+-transporting ATPase
MSMAVLHDAVPGRLRLRVTSLYRFPATAVRLEQSLCEDTTIIVVHIDLRRASVLLNYSADRRSAGIVKQLFACLGEPIVAGKRRRPTSRRPTSVSHRPLAITHPHTRPAKGLADLLGVDPATGLEDGQAVTRLVRHGPNRFATTGPRPALTALLKQLETLPVVMLGVSAAIALLTGGVADAVVILGVIGINSGIGYFTEQRAERTIRALDDVGERYSEVRRGGQRRQVPTADLVPGDVLVLGPGCRVGGDARLLHARHLTIDEAALTGESLPVVKQAYQTRPIDTPLGDRDNLVFMGTTVSGGNGLAMVVATGPRRRSVRSSRWSMPRDRPRPRWSGSSDAWERSSGCSAD